MIVSRKKDRQRSGQKKAKEKIDIGLIGKAGITKGGSITVPLASCFTGLD
jgi:hypothetical protein